MDKIGKIVASRVQPKPNYRLHSEMHALADEISAYFGERSRFAMYLGAIKRVGAARARAIFAEIKQSDARDPRKLFFWKTKASPDSAKRPAAKAAGRSGQSLQKGRKQAKLTHRKRPQQMNLWPSERS